MLFQYFFIILQRFNHKQRNMITFDDKFARSEGLLGSEKMKRLRDARIVIFGIGGVGSWCAEGLVRTGACHVTLVDSDDVDSTNINRQIEATERSVGLSKVETMKERLLSINSQADIVAIHDRWDDGFVGRHAAFSFDDYDFVVDAIDSVNDKILLILEATKSSSTLISSMGAARKTNPQDVRISEFWKVEGCPLARSLRNKMKQNKTFPSKKFDCVYSKERPVPSSYESMKGSIVQVTATFGFTLCSMIVNSI